jgi:UDP-N-acetylmuramoyl-L-alanyl-D-glutamate--2,6-diaminopimelate ligase
VAVTDTLLTVPTPPGLRPSSVAPRRLGDLAARLSADLVAGRRDAVDTVTVSGVTLDSRAVRPGDLFAALPGSAQHGSRFAGTVAEAGAVALLTDPEGAATCAATGRPVLVVDDPRAVLGDAAAWVYGHPARRLLTLGITGTNGKTTTSFLAESALRALGQRTGLIGTVETRVLDERISSVRTTPEAPDLHGLLAVMVERGVSAAVLEVSSHALSLHRVDGLTFDVAGFTNLSQDHLDFHPTMEDYFRAKASLFTPRRTRRGVICVDDVWGRRLAAEATVPVVTLRTVEEEGTGADWTVIDRHPTATGTAFTLRHRGGRTLRTASPLPGEFNVANAALAIVMLATTGLDAAAAAAGVAAAGVVPGRMERVTGGGAPGEPLGIVDYAHTPDAVAAALAALRPAAGRPLVAVLGAGGDRDRGKRPAMGLAAAQSADVVVVTDDNPRSEDPAQIRAAVLEGARGGPATVLEVGGRREAIARAVAAAWGGGTVFLAGKGHEQGQEVSGSVHPFDDRAALYEELIEAGRRRGELPGADRAEIREESST